MIAVIGLDGSPPSGDALALLEKATLVAGGQRHLDAVPVPHGARRVVMGDVTRALEEVERHAADPTGGPVVVLASGDPGFFGIVRALREKGLRLRVFPALSSVALAFARAGLPWDDAVVVSAHGRELRRAVNVCRARRKVAVLTAPGSGPAELAAGLAGVPRTLLVAERLGSADERVVEVPAARAGEHDWAEPNVVLCLAPEESRRGWVFGAAAPEGWALSEDEFAHRDGMVTKSEVRALALPRLAPAPGRLVWDVGAGSGSVGIECARFGAAVVAVERDAQQRARIKSNAERHGVEVQVVAGEAPAALQDLPRPDAVFVGGGGVPAVAAVAEAGAETVVVALAALDRFGPVKEALEQASYAVAGSLVSTSRLAPLPDGSSRLAAANPVLLVVGRAR
ncbi:precorrin-6Y C5,15-methyltransferase (decarboxylating) [Motilibacter rhizosphaerae]|uniref:Precorrin-6Y C5,15-methyltransferase (Decarboxylating) n=1 Tax=Motilibacter rhizosphaerae TaxID=598652 RepID=A0A4Q7NRZ0_9ACTN|nr:precorrin-6y C5,15-methyltransferase (decarboxylating) subunit CbiE [Motilibacter rhizosphaerae]RZS89841.1 precorrin-6Y C5,15-methyltransferase (decarboxylating) [Motilibacter rhizosphaerae]